MGVAKKLPTIAELHNGLQFQLIETLEHETLAAAISRYLKAWTPIKLLYLLINILAGVLITYAFWSTDSVFADRFSHMAIGFTLGFLVLIPIHEYIHALAYKFFGSTSVKVTYNFRRLTALCVADGFIINGQNFQWVCLAPLITINTILLIGYFLLPSTQNFFAGAFLFHTAACYGDIALVNLLWSHKNKQLWTYDDISKGQTHFFVAI